MKATRIQFLGLAGLAALLMAPTLRADVAAVTSAAPSAPSSDAGASVPTAVIEAAPNPAVPSPAPNAADPRTLVPTAVIQATPNPAVASPAPSAADPRTPVPTAVIQATPNPAVQGTVEKEHNAALKAELQSLRDRLLEDRAALKEAHASGDKDEIAAAKADVKADLRAMRDHRVSSEHERHSLNKTARESRDKAGKGAGKGISQRDKTGEKSRGKQK